MSKTFKKWSKSQVIHCTNCSAAWQASEKATAEEIYLWLHGKQFNHKGEVQITPNIYDDFKSKFLRGEE